MEHRHTCKPRLFREARQGPSCPLSAHQPASAPKAKPKTPPAKRSKEASAWT
jgi:hypothetical protein